ncbi:helix-turn-helix domain-containing protein [Dictyobacter alpinus]|nr:helix-turn-helix domain-containing protein [Dictyobacter alpinus]
MRKKNRQAGQEHVQSCYMSIEVTASPPPEILVTGYFQECTGYKVYRPHGSGSWLITYTLSGRGLYRQPGLTVEALPGDLILLQPDALHDYSVPTGYTWEFFWAHFQPRMNWLSWWQLPASGRGLSKLSVSTPQVRERLRTTFLKLHTDASVHFSTLPTNLRSSAEEPISTLQRELALNGLEELLLLAVREITQQQKPGLDPRIQFLLQLMARDLKSHYDLKTLGALVSLSPSRLSHLFKQETGTSLLNVLISLRLEKATRLLEFSTNTISTIAEDVGFNSSFYFSRQFHQHFGISPSMYRQEIEQRQKSE